MSREFDYEIDMNKVLELSNNIIEYPLMMIQEFEGTLVDLDMRKYVKALRDNLVSFLAIDNNQPERSSQIHIKYFKEILNIISKNFENNDNNKKTLVGMEWLAMITSALEKDCGLGYTMSLHLDTYWNKNNSGGKEYEYFEEYAHFEVDYLGLIVHCEIIIMTFMIAEKYLAGIKASKTKLKHLKLALKDVCAFLKIDDIDIDEKFKAIDEMENCINAVSRFLSYMDDINHLNLFSSLMGDVDPYSDLAWDKERGFDSMIHFISVTSSLEHSRSRSLFINRESNHINRFYDYITDFVGRDPEDSKLNGNRSFDKDLGVYLEKGLSDLSSVNQGIQDIFKFVDTVVCQRVEKAIDDLSFDTTECPFV